MAECWQFYFLSLLLSIEQKTGHGEKDITLYSLRGGDERVVVVEFREDYYFGGENYNVERGSGGGDDVADVDVFEHRQDEASR